MKHKVTLFAVIALLPFALLIALFELLPLAAMIRDSFLADDGITYTFKQYIIALTNPYYTKGMVNSLLISIYSSCIGLAIAIAASYSMTRMSSKIQSILVTFSNLTSNFSGVPLAFAFIILLGNSGVFTLLFKEWGLNITGSFNLYSWGGLVAVYVYFQVPLAILLLYPAYSGIHKHWRESASLLGASAFQFWLRIGFPVIIPSVVGTFSILLANAMGAYATAYALVGGSYNLLPTRIGALVAGDVATRPQLGSALAVILGLMMVVAMWCNERMMRRFRRDLR
ncbi:ABC transporter permease subunit [Paenibacillus filicis]|uniref:ABC transporter permease subunit n=1 Tax=Paenibacillus gyeongsangnamensis TaxID=3388067 RepID=A0ABT4Q231_9BACL|nr:ABC transporter permease subunit [Paenibacillus filicis]MCZ8510934.1 ABC transporter permease subunit [Paenibacillus filicis]